MKKLLAQIKSLSGLITAVAVISGATLWITKTSNNNTAEQQESFKRVFDSIADVKQMVEYVNIEQSMMSENIQRNTDTLKKIAQDNEQQSKDIHSLTWALRNQDQFTPDQMRDIIDELLKRTETLRPDPITLPPSSALTREHQIEFIPIYDER